MVGLSTKGEAAVLTPLTTGCYVSLHTADPGDTGLNEVSLTGTGYGRQGPATFTNSGNNPTVAANSAILTFAAASAPWGTITHFGTWDALSAGNFRGSGALSTAKPVNTGDTARFVAGALTITAQ